MALNSARNTSWSGGRRSFPAPMRQAILARDPICRCAGCKHCTPRGCAAPSTEADHIISHAECVRRGIEPDTPTNGQGLCASCHLNKTNAERQAARWGVRAQRPPEQHPGLA